MLYKKATTLRLIKGKELEAIETYNIFINRAHYDHIKIPESYFSIGVCYSILNYNITEIKNMYKLGIKYERYQLPFFIPYDSTSKELLISNIKIRNIISHKSTLFISDKDFKEYSNEIEIYINTFGGDINLKEFKLLSLKKDINIEKAKKLKKLGNFEFENNNYIKAIMYYNKAIQLGNCEAIYNLGYLLLHGKGIERNINHLHQQYIGIKEQLKIIIVCLQIIWV